MKFDLNAPNPIAPFRQLWGRILEGVLSKRLPHSANMYNMMLMEEEAGSSIQWYTLHGHISPDSWVVATYYREDKGMEFTISAPENPDITDEIKDAFASSALFDWTKNFCFSSIDSRLTPFLLEISARHQEFQTNLVPCLGYWMPLHEATSLQVKALSEGVAVRGLKDDADAVKFVVREWKYRKEGVEALVAQLLSRFPSGGVYVDEELVAAVVTKSNGALGMLYTAPSHRGQGFGKLLMEFMIKEWADKKMLPFTQVEIGNDAGIKFHQSLHFHLLHKVDFLEFLRHTSECE